MDIKVFESDGMRENHVRFTIDLPKDIHLQLKLISVQTGIPMGKLVAETSKLVVSQLRDKLIEDLKLKVRENNFS